MPKVNYRRSLKLTPNDVRFYVLEGLTIVDYSIMKAQKEVDDFNEVMNELNLDMGGLAASLNRDVDEVTKQATAEGVDIAECKAIQKQVPTIIDQIQAEVRKCGETQQQILNEWVDPLKALKPRSDAILEDTKKAVAQCDQNADVDENFVCLGKALVKGAEDTLDLSRQAKQLETIITKADAKQAVFTCVSQTLRDPVEAANEINDAAVKCIQDKIQN
jgi:hypothetical protein